jgi:hypothetical protein
MDARGENGEPRTGNRLATAKMAGIRAKQKGPAAAGLHDVGREYAASIGRIAGAA